mmetsp:Transcript_32296/g.75958  ORF Transcript_32296/g.75958 Transcript_32296/m.75958 type:complete len:94 (+) Transcript_32296:145-426(+)
MFASTSRRAVRTVFRPRFARTFAEDATNSTPTPPPGPGRISAFVSRVSSFLVGAGLTALATQYYIFEELRSGNKVLIEKQKAIEKRLKDLEDK